MKENIASFNKLGMISAILMVILIPIQIIFFVIWPHPTTIEGFFELFNNNWFLGLISFDLLYMVNNILLALLLISIFVALLETKKWYLYIGIFFSLFSITIYFSSNTAIEMLQASQSYFNTNDQSVKEMFLVVGETLYLTYKGTAYTVYYILNGISLILIFFAMFDSKKFRKITARFGLASGFLMLIPATAGIIGMTMSLVSLIPWSVFCILVALDFSKKIEIES